MSTQLDVPKRSKEMRIKIISITFSDGGDNGENGSFGVMSRKSDFLLRRIHGEMQLQMQVFIPA